MHVLIYERNHHGHRTMGVRVLLDALFDLNAESAHVSKITLATTAAAMASAAFAELIAPVEHRISFEEVPADAPGIQPESALLHAYARARDVSRLMASGRFDHMYTPFGDGALQLLAAWHRLPFVKPWPSRTASETVMMRTAFAYRSRRSALARLGWFGLQYSPFAKVHLIDPIAHRVLSERRPDLLPRVGLLPDPVNETPRRDRAAARKALGLPAGGRLIGCMGYLDERKGVDLLIAALQDKRVCQNDYLLLAGVQDPALKQSILQATQRDARILCIDRYLTESEVADVLTAVDIVAVPYRNFVGSASLVVRAASVGRPCLGTDRGWIGSVIPQFELGRVCDISRADRVADALVALLSDAASFKTSPAGERFIAYSSIPNIYAHWTALLRQRLGLPAHPAFVAWPGEQASPATQAGAVTL